MGRGSPRPLGVPIRASELDPEKTKEPAPVNVELGVIADLTPIGSPHPAVAFRPDPERVRALLDMWRAAFRKRFLPPHLASVIRGKTFYLLSATYGMVGRAATLPLVQRQYRDSTFGFHPGSELHHSYLFFRALLPNLPDLTIPITPSSTPPLLVYTDASFWLAKRGRGEECVLPRSSRLRGALGAVVWDPVTRVARYASAEPPWDILMSSWRHDRKTYIAELETLAAVAVYSTYPSLFHGRQVAHWIDNTVALSALVHGYAGKPDLAKAVNVFYLQMVGLRARVYFDYVPSKANIADLPSRERFAELRSELAGLDVSPSSPDLLVVPDVAAWQSPLRSWVSPLPHLSHSSMSV